MESRLPFDIKKSEMLTDSGIESKIDRMRVGGKANAEQEMVLKENRSIEVSSDSEMQKLKAIYEFLKSDPAFGKFVIDTHFIKAQRDTESPAKAYLVQKFIDGKRIDELTDEEIYSDKKLVAELLEFCKAAMALIENNKNNLDKIPDFYSDRNFLRGNLLHNPRYTGNIIIADPTPNSTQRVYFADTGALFGPGQSQASTRKLTIPINNALQLLQFRRWIKKLESSI